MSKEYPCVYLKSGLCYRDKKNPDVCSLGPCPYETKSNADLIRSMTDEQLADLILCNADAIPVCFVCDQFNAVNCDGDCMPALLKWLQSPVE